MYPANATRHDIAFTVTALCRYNSPLFRSHLTTSRRVLQYLKSTPDFQLRFSNTCSNDQLTGYTGSDWANYMLNAKEKGWRSSIVCWYKRRKTLHLYTEKRPYLAKPSITTEFEADYQCRRWASSSAWGQARLVGAGETGGGRRSWWGQARPMGAASHWPHARAHQHQTQGKLPGQIPSQHSPFSPRLSRRNETNPKKQTNKSLRPSFRVPNPIKPKSNENPSIQCRSKESPNNPNYYRNPKSTLLRPTSSTIPLSLLPHRP